MHPTSSVLVLMFFSSSTGLYQIPIDHNPFPQYRMSYYDLPCQVQGAFRTKDDLLNDTVLMSGGRDKQRQLDSWISEQGFLSEHEYVKETMENYLKETNGLDKVEVESGRLIYGCCPMVLFFTAPTELENILGERKKIVHFEYENPPKYQYIPTALCTGPKIYCEHGHCYNGTTVMNLLAHKTDKHSGIVLDQFEINTFCGCVHY